MKKILVAAICLMTAVTGLSEATPSQKIDYLVEKKAHAEFIPVEKSVSDSIFVRRAYLDIVGRIPTYAEYNNFIKTKDRKKLVVELLQTEGHVQYFYHFWADLLRLRDGRLNDNVGYLRGITYIDWIKEQIRNNTPYDKVVRDMLTATGNVWENPASGYYLRDTGMPLDNFSNTAQVFMGTDLSCAQCHDDPFQDWSQMDFYKLAAFTTVNSNTLTLMPQDKKKVVNDFQKVVREKQLEVTELARKGEKVDINRARLNNMRNFANASFRYSIAVNPKYKLTLPHDYQYDDAAPKSPVSPEFVFGREGESPSDDSRVEFAKWMTAPNHPSFSRNIANRIWEHLMGTPLVDNMDNMYATYDGKNKELLDYLESLIIELSFDIKRFQYHILMTNAYSRKAWEDDSGHAYVGQSPKLRRLTATQLWDSYMSLRLGDPDYFEVPDWRLYQVGNLQLEELNIQRVDSIMDNVYAIDNDRFKDVKKHERLYLMRSSHINGDNKTNSNSNLLKKLGFSDRSLVNDSNEEGSVSQVLLLANGPIIDIVFDKDSYFLKNIGTKDEVDYMWESFLQRKPTLFEKGEVTGMPKKDIVWVLLNSQEFRFTK